MPFLILFFLVSIAELYVFMVVGDHIGFIATLILCFLTAVTGGFLVRLQGISTLIKLQSSIRTGNMPLNEIFDGFCIAIAGILLITPGFLTDIVGFLLLFPQIRTKFRNRLTQHAKFKTKTTYYSDEIIEGDYERVDKTKPPLENQNQDT